MKLIELLVFCAILTIFVRVFTLASVQIVEYRARVVILMQKTDVVLQRHGDFLYKKNSVGGENAR